MKETSAISCIFCNSFYHVTQNCDIYITNESRKKIVRSKNLCVYCLRDTPCKSYPIEDDLCMDYQKCFICFKQRSHHSVFCPEKLTAPKSYPPFKIDKILLSRFFAFCSAAEKYSMLFSFPEISNYVHLKPLKVVHSMKLCDSEFYDAPISDSNVVVKDDIELTDCDLTIINNEAFLHNVMVRAECVSIYRSTLSPQELFHLLSFKTKRLNCWRLTLTSKVTFTEIVKRCPNIVDLQLFKYVDIVIENSWAEDLLKYQKGKNFHRLDLVIDSAEFDVKSLMEFVDTKCIGLIRITLHVDTSLYLLKYENIYQKLKKDLSESFCFADITKDRYSQYLIVNIAKRKLDIL